MFEIGFENPRVIELSSDDGERLGALKASVPRSAARRMTALGLLVHAVLEGRPLCAETTIVYQTAYSESRMLERFLTSFPDPSPLAFQASIHPSAVEQSLILRRCPVARLFPVAGRDGLFGGLRILRRSRSPAILVGGEECGEWLPRFGLAGEETFAWAVTSVSTPAQAEGILRWAPDGSGPREPAPFHEALRDRREWQWSVPGRGSLSLLWR